MKGSMLHDPTVHPQRRFLKPQPLFENSLERFVLPTCNMFPLMGFEVKMKCKLAITGL